jgi:hypothetical protein
MPAVKSIAFMAMSYPSTILHGLPRPDYGVPFRKNPDCGSL